MMVVESKDMKLPTSSSQEEAGEGGDTGHARLNELGYKQELKRDLSVVSNFAFSFSIISVLTGITTLYNNGLQYGGPAVMVYGWFVAGLFTMFVGSSMAEICSSYPTSGGLYYWSAKLAGPSWAPFASWITGWFNIVGQWAVTTSVDFSLAQLIQVIILLSTGGKNGGGYEASKYVVIAIHGGLYGNGIGGIICLGVVAVAIFFCGMSSVTSNSRMAYAFSRDGAMPFSSVWHKVNKQEVPINAVWMSAFISFCMALTSLGSLVAFEAMVSIATIGLYIAYALPIFFRVTLARKSFVPGPFNLGKYGVVVGWVSVLWVVTISVLFSLPVSYPITTATLNYTPVAVGGLLLVIVGSWILNARHWFKGPVKNIHV